jgi:hypothetical protein
MRERAHAARGTMPSQATPELRRHPQMRYRGQRNWPPAWLWMGEGERDFARGEVGVLTRIDVSIQDPHNPFNPKPYNRIYLFMEHRGSGYIGCLLFDDPAACRQVGKILSDLGGWTLKEIGDLDLTHLL